MRHYFLTGVLLLLSTQALAQGVPINQQTTLLNPDISLNGLFSVGVFSGPENLQFGGHDPKERGFTLQNLELTLGANVDPYFRADTNLVFGLEKGESFVEVEEAYLTTLALPYRLQFIGGQFFTRFGRINSQHPHSWSFADQPVIANRLFGPDGLRNPGMQLSWLAPLPFYLELIGSVQNAKGATAISFISGSGAEDHAHGGGGEPFGERPLLTRDVQSLNDLLYMGRLKSAWSPSDTVEAVMGVSGLWGPNAGGRNTQTEIFGLDFYGKWKPLNAEGDFPFVAFQAEGIWRNYEADEATAKDGDFFPADTLRDSGFYAQGLWGFTRRWVAGTRVEYADGDDAQNPLRDKRLRLSPNLTFYPSEFSKFRLQYNVDFAEHKEDKALHAVFLQFEFLVGKHGAHLF
jgi:hypothetical protein